MRVRGPVGRGDLILPSGLGDGTAAAIRPGDLQPERLADVIGRAWGATDPSGPSVQRVTCAIGLERDGVAALALRSVREELEGLRASMDAITARLDSLEQR